MKKHKKCSPVKRWSPTITGYKFGGPILKKEAPYGFISTYYPPPDPKVSSVPYSTVVNGICGPHTVYYNMLPKCGLVLYRFERDWLNPFVVDIKDMQKAVYEAQTWTSMYDPENPDSLIRDDAEGKLPILVSDAVAFLCPTCKVYEDNYVLMQDMYGDIVMREFHMKREYTYRKLREEYLAKPDTVMFECRGEWHELLSIGHKIPEDYEGDINCWNSLHNYAYMFTPPDGDEGRAVRNTLAYYFQYYKNLHFKKLLEIEDVLKLYPGQLASNEEHIRDMYDLLRPKPCMRRINLYETA